MRTRNKDNYTTRDLDECTALMEEVVEQKGSIEELSDRCESLMELAAYAPIRDEVLNVQTVYTTILTTVQKYDIAFPLYLLLRSRS